MHTAAITRAEITSATQEYRGRDERISRGECVTGIFLLEIRHPQNTRAPPASRRLPKSNAATASLNYCYERPGNFFFSRPVYADGTNVLRWLDPEN